MSVVLRLLNPWLRAIEKRRILKGTPTSMRRALELQARLFFHPPRGTQQKWIACGEVPCLEITPRTTHPRRVLFYIHGGGFVFGSPDTDAAMVAQLAQRTGARAILPKYRLAPEAPFPAAPQDVRAAWDGLMAQGVAPSDIVVGGDSAGGALAFGLIASLCAEGAAQPGAVFAFSPLTDLTHGGQSFKDNAAHDVILPSERASEMAEMFLCGHKGTEPSVSPLFGEFKAAPPSWITVSDTEILLDDSRRLAARLRDYGRTVELVERHNLPHVWPLFHNILPEARQTLDALAHWVRQQQDWEA